jgi:hypothetical protein
MANEVRITLTDEQKAKIKEATGKDLGQIRVSNLGNNPAVTPTTSAKVATARYASPKLASPKLASPKLASPKLASPKLASPKLASPRSSNDV